ncbi:Gfo/Idh/MocA family oxidoreductase [Litorilinea aerophila]|uniref:Gfo/Idh/MocA family oxidoreductase n=1 Tax=Litorilinea aerophila TaxID=1204385 RepID=A0A540VE77_9CHLR|nr:Gfo/Idh/MocA family oxidoreductase [Litorilinea aerophila]MCC9077215.1 Gfo/Idh/MocA family oxidoreductase [Litorilinea aerophila]GIV78938.1 MAG: oxidoreductase [Litorilinea sp.]
MTNGHQVTMLGTGLIGMFYTMTLHGQRSRDRVGVIYSRTPERAEAFAREWGIPHWTSDLAEAINHPETDTVVIGLPNHLHEELVQMAADAGKAVLCTKPLGRNAAEAKRMLETVEKAGVFAGYLEDLCYTPKTLKALQQVQSGALGKITWARSRETHPGPHSAWFWDARLAGGGAIVDLGCHCIEIIRNFVGKDNRPLEVMCWADTLVHPIEAEDNGIALIRFESGAIGQFEVSWTFRGGMDLRDEVAGTEGTIWLNHFLRTGFEVFTSGQGGAYVAEKAETESGWLFPVGDEVSELGYVDMFTDMFNAMDEGRQPRETFYDGYVVNAIMDACYRSARSKRWEPVELEIWRGGTAERIQASGREYDGHVIIKQERMPDGRLKMILKNKQTGEFSERVVSDA